MGIMQLKAAALYFTKIHTNAVVVNALWYSFDKLQEVSESNFMFSTYVYVASWKSRTGMQI